MRNISILDCTLRDGGCVNNFNFGSIYMNQILHGLEEAGVEYIEVGYIDQKAGSRTDRTQFSDEVVIREEFLRKKKPNAIYVAMIDYGKFDPHLLESCNHDGIDGIRLAFHKKDRKEMIFWGREILNKGYKLFIQPMIGLRYTDEELLDLIRDVNTELPTASAFYIVDSFGEMRLNDINRMANLVDHNLRGDMPIGFHSHNNLQLSYSNAVTLLNFPCKRDVIFDSSIMGMGKGAGNLNTELFAEHLNIYEEKDYDVAPLLEVMDKCLNQIKQTYYWGYSVEYYLSAANHCTPSYAKHFYYKHLITVDQLSELLGMIQEDKKVSFDIDYADKLFYKYNAQVYNDEKSIEILSEKLNNREVLLIGPGQSVNRCKGIVTEYIKKNDVVTIAINNLPDFEVDWYFVTKRQVFQYLSDVLTKCIVTSNVIKNGESIILSYSSCTNGEFGHREDAFYSFFNLLSRLQIKSIAFAGFDGFTSDLNDNYYDDRFKRPINGHEADNRNQFNRYLLNKLRERMKILFITPSIYERS